MASICDSWNIPYIDLSKIHPPEEISAAIDAVQPKIILSSIECISSPAIQDQINALDVAYVAVDECQVQYQFMKSLRFQPHLTCNYHKISRPHAGSRSDWRMV